MLYVYDEGCESYPSIPYVDGNENPLEDDGKGILGDGGADEREFCDVLASAEH